MHAFLIASPFVGRFFFYIDINLVRHLNPRTSLAKKDGERFPKKIKRKVDVIRSLKKIVWSITKSNVEKLIKQ